MEVDEISRMAELEQGSSSDDEPRLSEHAMAALREFYAERVALEERRENSEVEEDWVRGRW